jgi:hypothetical protein
LEESQVLLIFKYLQFVIYNIYTFNHKQKVKEGNEIPHPTGRPKPMPDISLNIYLNLA